MKILFKSLSLLFFLFINILIYANFNFLNNNITKPLTVNEAFNIEFREVNNKLYIYINIEKDHYIYENSLKLKINNNLYQNYKLNSILIKDEFYGNSFVLKEPQTIILDYYNQIKNIEITFQGCSPLFNICYPYETIKKDFNNIINDKDNYYFNKENVDSFEYLKNLFLNKGLFLKIIAFFLIGVLISFTPCILPMIPIVSSLIISKEKITKIQAFYLTFSYVFGSAISYGLIGLLSSYSILGVQQIFQSSYFLIFGIALLFILSLSLFDIFQINIFNNSNNKINNLVNKFSNNYFNIIIIGFLSSLIISPCVAAPLAGILLYTTTLDNPYLSFLYLFIFGLGAGFVLILIGTSLNTLKIKTGNYMNFVKYLIGFMLIVICVFLLERFIENKLILNYLYDISVILFTAIIFSKMKFNKNITYLLILSFIFITHILISSNLKLTSNENLSNLKYHLITKDTVINKDKSIIKVTADWCIYCKNMEKDFYNNKNYEDLLSNYKLYSLDITTLEDFEYDFLKNNQIIGAPALLIYINGKIEYKINGQANLDDIIKIIK